MDGADNFDLATTDTLAYTSGMYRYEEKKKEEEYAGRREISGNIENCK